MIKPGALLMGVTMAVVSAGTYYGLELLPPGLIPAPIGRVVAEAQPAHPTPAPLPPVAAAAPAPEPAPAPEAAPTEQDLAEEPPPPAAEAAPEAAPEAPAEPAPAPAPVAKAPPPKPEPKPAPAPEQETPKKAETVASAPPVKPAPAKAPPEADVLKPWWPTDTSKMPATQLKLQYAGQVKGQGAIALLFSAPLNLDSVKSHASVRSASGASVDGAWEAGKNPKLVVFSGLTPGRYTVILQPQVADQQGYMLGQTLKGPVYIKE